MASFRPLSAEINVLHDTKNPSLSVQATDPLTKSHLQVGLSNVAQGSTGCSGSSVSELAKDTTGSFGFSVSKLLADHVATDSLHAQFSSPIVQSQVSSVVLTTPPAIHAPQDVHVMAAAKKINHDKEASNASHINGLHAAKEKESTRSLHAKVPHPLLRQEPSHLPSTVVVRQNDLPNVVYATHSPEVTTNDFEDGEVFTNNPVVAARDSPSRLTWADQASSGEFIPQEALELEEEYGWFLVNPDLLHLLSPIRMVKPPIAVAQRGAMVGESFMR
ncbi:hypothetical protein F0562_007645 [Nyssa sinensis]|uniref:Uncharacterized protein n=1 Tax=Nyssa sinensis TaxID=561372 RepID=A0A5J5A5M9_9ASTE|nr:hypothetical protein F0562_007645 [Nyssa sinensis]